MTTFLSENDYQRSFSAHFLEDIIAVLARHMTSKPHGPSSILDIGCGYGGIAAELKEALDLKTAHGIDIHPQVASEVSEKGVDFQQWDANTLPLPYDPNSMSLVASFGVLDYFNCYDGLFEEFRRILVPNGILAISMPNLASWHNRVALLLGYQPRDIEISKNWVVGVHPHYKHSSPEPVGHMRTPTALALAELAHLWGFDQLELVGLTATNRHRPSSRTRSVIDKLASRRANLAKRFLYVGYNSDRDPSVPAARGWWSE